MTSENAAFENTDSEDDLPMTSLKMKLETQTDNEDEVLDDEEEADLNMTVEAEGENSEAFGYTTNKIIIGKMRNIKKLKKKFATKKKKKKKKKRMGQPNGDEDEQEVEEIEEAAPTDLADVSSSDTDGEIPILADVHPPLSHHNQYFKSFKFGPPKEDLIGNKVSEITDGFGEPITVVTIKQEYNEDDDDDMAIDNLNGSIDEPAEIKEEPETKIKVKHKHKKIRKDLTDEELVELNVKFIFTCQICPLEFADCVQLKTHVSTHDQVGTYLCRMCERVYQNIEDLRLHMASHMRAGSHACSECGKRYHHSQSLVAHRKRWHTAERPFSCHVCAKSYSLKNDLTTHIKCHSQDRFPCQFCDKAFRTDRYLRIHTKHVHLGHKYVTIECEICHKHFQKKNLLNHMKSHEEKIHKCHYCGKCMTTSYSLVAHIRRHEGIKPFVCEICNKAFVDKGKLSRHIHSHAATRDFQCDMCEKSFSEGQYLRQHKRTHDLTREYPCRVCGTKFKSMNSVWSHMRKHTHTNRYECHFCGKTCYRPDHLRSHLISHTGIKDFQCEICSKRFAKSYDLTEHRRSHSGERPYHCLLCQRSFARHGEFRKHKMSKYHREREADAGLAPAVPEAPVPPSGGDPAALPADPEAPPATPDLSHACPPCDKHFSSAPGLAAHKRRKSHLAKTGQAVDD